jgi:hypothetical protein
MKKVNKKIKNERQLQSFSGRTAQELPKKLQFSPFVHVHALY